MTWLLTTCASVQEVRLRLPDIIVAAVPFGPWQMVPPVHAAVYDATGAALVIEYIQGRLHLYDNPFGVCTNAPAFDWHMTHLRSYTHLSVHNDEQAGWSSIMVLPLAQGSGMRGLPGDVTSPSRFVRAVYATQTAVGIADAQEARRTAFRILDMFSIPRGMVREETKDGLYYERVQWTSACDLAAGAYYIHTYDNRQVRMVSVHAAKHSEKVQRYALHHLEQHIDVTKP
jgi:choloylglycine hydrolase